MSVIKSLRAKSAQPFFSRPRYSGGGLGRGFKIDGGAASPAPLPLMPGMRDPDRRLRTFARNMRQAPTDAERKLWFPLRRGKLDGYHFRRQVPIAGYIIDFCCLSAGLGVEADGGRHYDAKGQIYDQRRTEALREAGIRIIRFTDYEILKYPEAVQRTIYRELTERPPP